MKHLLVILFLSAAVFAGCNKDNSGNEVKNDTTVQKTEMNDNNIIRAKDVKVVDIDVNKDNKVFQCPMHADVISDKQEPCPKCKMDLDEVTVGDAQESLK